MTFTMQFTNTVHNSGDEHARIRGAYTLACGVCLKREPKYTCPRCFIQYCSKECYTDKRHEGACSEAFYEKQVRVIDMVLEVIRGC